MGLFDDIKKQAESAVSKLGSNVNDYLKTNVTAAFVKVGEPPKGNLTPEQIAQGQTGQAATAQVAQPASGMQSMMSGPMMYALPIVAGIVVLALVLKRK